MEIRRTKSEISREMFLYSKYVQGNIFYRIFTLDLVASFCFPVKVVRQATK